MHSATETATPAPEVKAAHALRVAFFSDAFAERNGTGAYYHDLLEQLRPRLADVQIFQPGQSWLSPLLSIPMPGDAAQRLALPPWRGIAQRLEQQPPDLVVAVTPGPYGLLGVHYARRHGLPLLGGFHTDFEQLARLYWGPLQRTAVSAVLSTANRLLCRYAHCMLINHSALAAPLGRLGARRAVVMGTPLQREFLERAPQAIPHQLRHVCFAGRLASEKNLETILQAARSLPQLRFTLAGEGPLRPRLEQQAADLPNVHFTGWLDRTALIALLDSASLLLLPSHVETFGSIALEAMARGRPAVVSTTAGIARWSALRPGLLYVSPQAPLDDTLRRAAQWRADDWQRRSVSARAVAEQLNRDTLEDWTVLLSTYAGLLRKHTATEAKPALRT